MIAVPETTTLLLAHRSPMDLAATLGYLAARAVPGVEALHDGAYQRVVVAPHGPALVTVDPAGSGSDAVACRVRLADERDLAAVVARVRHLLDLDADPLRIDDALAADPALHPLVMARPGLRSPGSVDGFELAVRAVVGQQISVAAARTVLGRLTATHGRPAFPDEPWRCFPDAPTIAALDPAVLPLPRARARPLVGLATSVASGALDLGPDADREAARRALVALPGIGPWTADYVRMRALGDADVLLVGDLGVVRAAAALGTVLTGGRPDWAPWRSYASHHLWASLGGSAPATSGPR